MRTISQPLPSSEYPILLPHTVPFVRRRDCCSLPSYCSPTSTPIRTDPVSLCVLLSVVTKRREEVRRQRIESEQRRRDELRDGYRRLKDVLPVSNQKSSKVSLLDRGACSPFVPFSIPATHEFPSNFLSRFIPRVCFPSVNCPQSDLLNSVSIFSPNTAQQPTEHAAYTCPSSC